MRILTYALKEKKPQTNQLQNQKRHQKKFHKKNFTSIRKKKNLLKKKKSLPLWLKLLI